MHSDPDSRFHDHVCAPTDKQALFENEFPEANTQTPALYHEERALMSFLHSNVPYLVNSGAVSSPAAVM